MQPTGPAIDANEIATATSSLSNHLYAILLIPLINIGFIIATINYEPITKLKLLVSFNAKYRTQHPKIVKKAEILNAVERPHFSMI